MFFLFCQFLCLKLQLIEILVLINFDFLNSHFYIVCFFNYFFAFVFEIKVVAVLSRVIFGLRRRLVFRWVNLIPQFIWFFPACLRIFLRITRKLKLRYHLIPEQITFRSTWIYAVKNVKIIVFILFLVAYWVKPSFPITYAIFLAKLPGREKLMLILCTLFLQFCYVNIWFKRKRIMPRDVSAVIAPNLRLIVNLNFKAVRWWFFLMILFGAWPIEISLNEITFVHIGVYFYSFILYMFLM